jgi:hypothetical protein
MTTTTDVVAGLAQQPGRNCVPCVPMHSWRCLFAPEMVGAGISEHGARPWVGVAPGSQGGAPDEP